MSRWILGAALLFAAVGFAISCALRFGVDPVMESFERLFGPGRTRAGGSTWRNPRMAPHLFELKVERTPDSWWVGGETVACEVTIDAEHYLRAVWLYSADDADDDGRIDSTEWSRRGTATLDESPGRTIARIEATHIDRGADAIRIVTDDCREGIWYRQHGRSDLSCSAPCYGNAPRAVGR